MSLVSSFKGWVGEMQGTLAAKIQLESQVYRSINNVTIPTSNGTTQIDHIIVSRYGVFIADMKNINDVDGVLLFDQRKASGHSDQE